jgi:hypothetical protein
VGVGGEYPLASSSAAERAEADPALRERRGEVVVLTFSQQGWGEAFGGWGAGCCGHCFQDHAGICGKDRGRVDTSKLDGDLRALCRRGWFCWRFERGSIQGSAAW